MTISSRICVLLVATLAVLCQTAPACARKIRLRNEPKQLQQPSETDSLRNMIAADSVPLRFSGYDKPANANRETFLATNLSLSDTVCNMEVEIEYSTMDHRQLHKRKVMISCMIPPGETRMLEIRTWDRQNSYRYYRSREGRSAAVPYTVSISPLRCWLRP